MDIKKIIQEEVDDFEWIKHERLDLSDYLNSILEGTPYNVRDNSRPDGYRGIIIYRNDQRLLYMPIGPIPFTSKWGDELANQDLDISTLEEFLEDLDKKIDWYVRDMVSDYKEQVIQHLRNVYSIVSDYIDNN